MAHSLLSSPRSVLTRVAALARTAASIIQHRRSVRELAMFDDRMLRDIGLIRQDVSSALAGSLLADPSLALAERVAAARAAARAQARDTRARLAADFPDASPSGSSVRHAA